MIGSLGLQRNARIASKTGAATCGKMTTEVRVNGLSRVNTTPTPTFLRAHDRPAGIRGVFRRPPWLVIRAFGSSRLIRTSFVWVVLVPVAARLLLPIAGQHTLDFEWLDSPITLTITLPFRWYVFCAMAISFAIAQGTYFLQCPSRIREFKNWSDFSSSNPGTFVLSGYVIELLSPTAPRWFSEELHAGFRTLAIVCLAELRTIAKENNGERALSDFRDAPSSGSSGRINSDLFTIVREYQSVRNPWSASTAAAAVFFTIGAALFGWVVVDGARSVLNLVFVA